MSNNSDQKTVDGFGDEWERFDQSQLAEDEQQVLFDKYFSIFSPGPNCLQSLVALIWAVGVAVGQAVSSEGWDTTLY